MFNSEQRFCVYKLIKIRQSGTAITVLQPVMWYNRPCSTVEQLVLLCSQFRATVGAVVQYGL